MVSQLYALRHEAILTAAAELSQLVDSPVGEYRVHFTYMGDS